MTKITTIKEATKRVRAELQDAILEFIPNDTYATAAEIAQSAGITPTVASGLIASCRNDFKGNIRKGRKRITFKTVMLNEDGTPNYDRVFIHRRFINTYKRGV